MDMDDKDEFGLEKRNADPLNYHSSNISQDWQFGASNLPNQSMGLVPMNDSIATCKGGPIVSSTCSSVSMTESFCPNLWSHQNSENLRFDNSNIQSSTSASNIVAVGKGVPGPSRTATGESLDLGWNLSKRDAFLHTGGEIMPLTLSEFPADSAFIERAARFSCFNSGTFCNIVNPYSISESMNPYLKDGVAIQCPPEVLSDNGLKPTSGFQSKMNEPKMTEAEKETLVIVERGIAETSPIKDRKIGGFIRSPGDQKKEIGASSNLSHEVEATCSGRQVGPSMMEAAGEPSASKGLGLKKRRRNDQDTENERIEGSPQFQGEMVKDESEAKLKNDQNPTTTAKATKHGKDNSQNSDAAKEDYIHVRARRGQATNSHSLAERVRREKISERMKYLQDLVPGCNKVTGKAVMLDEIINYVQSLQRQVEFLSMKLATVNPRLDLNTEAILAKDVLQSRGGPSTFPFSPDTSMVHTQLHPSQQGLVQTGIPGTGNPTDALRRTISSQLMAMSRGYKDSTQIPNMWDEELNNVFQMSFGTNAPFHVQDLNGSLPPGHTKVEL